MSGSSARQPTGTLAWSEGLTNVHYDQDPEVFRLFLDPRMKYSVGLFESDADTDLAAAQTRKLHFIADALGIRGGESCLDIGCGWGSVVLFMASEHGCHVTGVTPSPKQAEYIRERAEQLGVSRKVDVRVSHFEDVSLPRGRFDAISMVGSIVHMSDKPYVLERCRRLARKGARIYLSETCFRNDRVAEEFQGAEGVLFLRDRIFGWGEIIPVSRYVAFFEDAGFSLKGLHDITRDYSRTLHAWKRNLETHRGQLDGIRPGLTDEYHKYFDICDAAWGFTTKQYAIVGSASR